MADEERVPVGEGAVQALWENDNAVAYALRFRLQNVDESSFAVAGSPMVLSCSRNLAVDVVNVVPPDRPWNYWLSECDQPKPPYDDVRLPPTYLEMRRKLEPSVIESWSPRTRLGSWFHGDRIRRWGHPDGGILHGRLFRVNDESSVKMAHSVFAGLGEETKGTLDIRDLSQVPLSREEVGMIEELGERWPEVNDSFLIKFDYDMDYMLTLSKHGFPTLDQE